MEVLSPGLLSMFQDLGRPGYSHLGVSMAGAADPVSARVANRLVGNPDDAVVIECTLQGPRLRVLNDAWVAVCGGEFDCNVGLWQSVFVRAGSVLEIGGSRSGARCYLAMAGGFAAPLYLGSASTHLLSGMGSPLRRGDMLRRGVDGERPVESRRVEPPVVRTALRVTGGADLGGFDSREVFGFLSCEFEVSEDSNRQGLRLRGGEGVFDTARHGARLSEGVALGAIQVPPDGDPVLLFVDSQTTGGYPVVANVIAADQRSVGQLRPRDRVRFEAVTLGAAREALLRQEEWIRRVAG